MFTSELLLSKSRKSIFVADIKTAVTAVVCQYECKVSGFFGFGQFHLISVPFIGIRVYTLDDDVFSVSLEEIHSIFADIVFRSEPNDGTLVVNRLAYAQTDN